MGTRLLASHSLTSTFQQLQHGSENAHLPSLFHKLERDFTIKSDMYTFTQGLKMKASMILGGMMTWIPGVSSTGFSLKN